jgi:hypothetical protein
MTTKQFVIVAHPESQLAEYARDHFPHIRVISPINFADEAVRNCNTNPRRANTVADAQVEPEIAKTKETQ